MVQFRKKDYIAFVNSLGILRGYLKCEVSPGSEKSCVVLHLMVATLLKNPELK